MTDRLDPSTSEMIYVGVFGGAFGVKGEVRVKSFCAEPTAIGDYSPLSDEDMETEYTLTLSQAIKGGYAVRVDGVTTKEQADLLNGVKLYAERSALPDLPDDEFYHTDLIGLTVLDTGGVTLGKVKNVANHGAGDILEITAPTLSEPAMLPFTLEAVPTVDLSKGRIIADPPAGVFPDPDEDDDS